MFGVLLNKILAFFGDANPESTSLLADDLATACLRLVVVCDVPPVGKSMWVSSKSTSGRKEGNVLFNDALNTFYLRLYGVRLMVKDHSDSEKGNPLLPHWLLFPINSKGSFI